MLKKLLPTTIFWTASFVKTALAVEEPSEGAAKTENQATEIAEKAKEGMGIKPPDLGVEDILPLFYKGLTFLPYVLGPLAVLMILYSGISFIIAMGDEEKVKKAKSAFMQSLIGAALLLVFTVLLLHYFPLEKMEEIKPY